MKHSLQSTAPVRWPALARRAALAGATLMAAAAGGSAAQGADTAPSAPRAPYVAAGAGGSAAQEPDTAPFTTRALYVAAGAEGAARQAADTAPSAPRALYVAAGAGGSAAQEPDAAPSAPRALYVAACASCHGADAQGNRLIDAPVLSGLSAAYLERQIDGFRQGYRGGHPDDPEGREMRPMIDGFTDADLATLAEWLASLPLPAPAGAAAGGVEAATGAEAAAADEAAPEGDPSRGRTLYAACAVCHGRSGEGNDALGAPRLAGQASWYTARQLRKFIDGVRGSHPDDTSGASMRTSVADLEPGDVADVVAWIETLRQQPAQGE